MLIILLADIFTQQPQTTKYIMTLYKFIYQENLFEDAKSRMSDSTE